MSYVRFLGYQGLSCGCVLGRYREVASNRELTYVEEKGATCEVTGHRRNHTLSRGAERDARPMPPEAAHLS